MPGVEWLELQYRHIPDRYDRRKSLWDEHLVRYFGGYSDLAQPTAERLANEILGPGTFKQIQDTA